MLHVSYEFYMKQAHVMVEFYPDAPHNIDLFNCNLYLHFTKSNGASINFKVRDIAYM